ncbi:hypothetical protein [Pantoea sp. 1.19]|uniref:hypothetical protein n=1 Tax=Pantoea sp. 1.19 TaxID=1925589 RepID=UPI0011151768|nr:hypothetical protein [Pantoea sp. 1.19]
MLSYFLCRKFTFPYTAERDKRESVNIFVMKFWRLETLFDNVPDSMAKQILKKARFLPYTGAAAWLARATAGKVADK